MATIYRDSDCNLKLLDGKVIGIVGYGNQGHAHAQNLRDSGCQVIVAEVKGSAGWADAKKAGFEVMATADMAKKADIVLMLAPDQLQKAIYYQSIEGGLAPGNTLMFAHGFNIHFGQIIPPPEVDVSMIAPKCPGHMLRQLYTEGIGPPAIVAVHQDASGKALEVALAYAKGIGCSRAGVIETTFAEETETDLFGEQAVLCGGVTSLIKAGFETLVEAGYQPEIAYFECMHELKLIVDLMYEKGIYGMRQAISNTAKYGDVTVGPQIIDKSVKERMKNALAKVQDGSFAKEWMDENKSGRKKFNALLEGDREHQIEKIGRVLRGMMPWLKK